jgi:hypothetical protein
VTTALPFLDRIVLTVIGRLPPPATIPTASDGTLSECRVTLTESTLPRGVTIFILRNNGAWLSGAFAVLVWFWR